MLRKRIIPCLDVSAGRVVKGINFVNLRDCGDPVEAALRYAEQGADEIVWLNITATGEDPGVLLEAVERAAEQIDERDGGWLFTWEAAPRLRVQEKTLRERLAKWEQRQALGWPVWDGHQWRIPAWAVDSTRCSVLLATLPSREPLPHLLPDWCDRQA